MAVEVGWVDENYWPGPDYIPSFNEVMQKVTRQFSKTAGQSVSLIQALTALTNMGIEMSEWQKTQSKVPRTTGPAPVAGQTGPRRGSQFDHRGRRRW